MKALATGGYVEANRRVSQVGDATDVSETDLVSLLDQVPSLPTEYPDAFTFESSGETITWHNYESLLWTLGESFRQILKKQRALRRSEVLWQRIEAVCLEPRYGKGRESFTMLLGQYGGRDRVPVLLKLLDDADVYGHALYALRLLGVPDAIGPARRLLDSPRTWVRREARKYLAKVGAQQSSSDKRSE